MLDACAEPPGVAVTLVDVAVRDDRAVSGVGALINDFLGVSVNCLLRLPIEVGFGAGGGGFGRRPAVTNGWRIAACGLIRLSGSQTRHFEMKSTNSSSVQRRTCASVFVPGLRRRPFELITALGEPLGSIKRGMRLKMTWDMGTRTEK